MTMRTCTTLLFGALLGPVLFAQDVIVRQHNGQAHFYYGPNTGQTIASVLNDVPPAGGDTIYLAGVDYAITVDLIINKRVVMIGSGVHPDSSAAYGGHKTRFVQGNNNDVFIANTTTDPSNAEFYGITFTGKVAFGISGSTSVAPPPSTSVSGVKFNRCEFNKLWFRDHDSGSSAATGTRICNCVVHDNLMIHNAMDTHIWNSFIGEMKLASSGTEVFNCVFMDFNQHYSSNPSNAGVNYSSNIFLRATGTADYIINEASSFRNNLFVVQGTSMVTRPNALLDVNNAQVATLGSVFVNNSSYTDFDHHNDYHLIPSAYQTMAYNGGEVGVYGTEGQPLKEGFIPFNPHWTALSATGSTGGGVLSNVTIQGSAQTH